jgi:hypothetical protein
MVGETSTGISEASLDIYALLPCFVKCKNKQPLQDEYKHFSSTTDMGMLVCQITPLQVEDSLTNKCPTGLCFDEFLYSAGWSVTNILGQYIGSIFKDILTLHDGTNLMS